MLGKRDFKKPCANKTPSFQPDSRDKWMPNYEDPCVVTPVTTSVNKTLMPMQSRNTLSKNQLNQKSKSSISCKPEKAT